MSKTQTYSMEKILAAQKVLRELPAKEREQTRAEVVEFLKADLRKAVKGHSLKDIQATLVEQGITVSLAGMEAVLGKQGKGAVRQRADSGKPSPKAETTKPPGKVTQGEAVKPETRDSTPAQKPEPAKLR